MLDPKSLKREEANVSDYRNYGKPTKSFTDANIKDVLNPPYKHYEKAGIKIRLPGKTKKIRQVPAEHEFGHMIGLAADYHKVHNHSHGEKSPKDRKTFREGRF